MRAYLQLVATVLAISGEGSAGADQPPQAAPAAASVPAGIAAVVNGQSIPMSALEARVVPAYSTLELQLLSIRHQTLQPLIEDAALRQEAQRRGMSPERLLDQVKDLDSITVTAEEIQEFFDENEEQFPSGIEAARGTIGGLLREQKADERRRRFARDLAGAARVVVYLPPKPVAVAPIRPGATEPAPEIPPAPPGPPGVVAEVNGAAIRASDLEAALPELAASRARLRRKIDGLTLGKIVDEMLVEQEAVARGTSSAGLRDAVTAQVAVSSEEVDATYRRMKRSPGEDDESLKAKIAERLRRARAKKAWDDLVANLRAKATIAVNIKGPDGTPLPLYHDH
jgi:hypothetical protein